MGSHICQSFKLYKCNYLQHSGGGGGGSPVARSLHFESLERDSEGQTYWRRRHPNIEVHILNSVSVITFRIVVVEVVVEVQ